jgi:hypothetical protein
MTTHWMDDGAVLAAALAFVDECESSLAVADLDDAPLPTLEASGIVQDELVVDECTAIDELLDFETTRHSVDANAGVPQLPVVSAVLEANAPAVQHCAERTNPNIKKSREKPTRSDPNRSRNERKQELIYFRNKVAELEARLRDMLRQKKPREPPILSSATDQVRSVEERNGQELGFSTPLTAALSFHPTSESLWKEIASSQSNERARSERENIRLKLVLENQLRVANNLQKFLSKSTATRVRSRIFALVVFCRISELTLSVPLTILGY